MGKALDEHHTLGKGEVVGEREAWDESKAEMPSNYDDTHAEAGARG